MADHLCADHHERLTHHRVHFPRHDGAARLRCGQSDFTDAAPRPASEPANIVRDLEKSYGDCFQFSARFDHRVLSPLRFEVIFCLVKCDPSALLDVVQHFPGKIDMAIQTRANRSSAERNLPQSVDGLLRAILGVGNLLRVSGKFLAKPDRRCVHQMGPADLHDVPEFLRFCFKRGV